MLKNKKAVIFDLDGTLIDSNWIWKSIDIEFLGKYGIILPEQLQKDIEGMSFTEIAIYFKERFGLKESLDEIKEIWNTMAREKYEKEVPLKNGAKDFIRYLKKKGFLLGIATSNSRLLAEASITSHGIADYFSCLITSCDVKKGKPSPDVYLAAAKALGVEPKHCLVFEDIMAGIHAGQSAGMEVCAVYDDHALHQQEEKIKTANYYIKDFTEINYEEE